MTVPVGATARVHVPAASAAEVTVGGVALARAAGVSPLSGGEEGDVSSRASARARGSSSSARRSRRARRGSPARRRRAASCCCVAPAFDGAGAATLSYAWQRDGEPIAGADGARYVVTTDDLARRLSCVATATNEVGAGSAESAAVVPVRDGAAGRDGSDGAPGSDGAAGR